MNIACFGYVDRDAGSVATANFLMLEELLRRGHNIDFYTFEGFVYPEGLFAYPNFQYHTVPSTDLPSITRFVPGMVRNVIGKVLSDYYYYQNMQAVSRLIETHHAQSPYDLLLFLGTAAQCEAPAGVPVVAWVQGPPQTEWEAIRALRSQIISLCGVSLYAKLKAYYAFKQYAARTELSRADLLICGSEWAREQIVRFGQPADRVRALPYPIDLDHFRFAPPMDAAPHRFLWLGRIDPRKRLDLMLDGVAQLLERRSDIHLDVIGRFSYAEGYRSLLDAFPYPDHLSYTESIPRADVPALMAQSHVLVQPSMNENFGSSLAEALSCGRPVVIGPTNGTGDVTGPATFRFSEYTPSAVAAALDASLHSWDQNATSLARTARRTAEHNFAPSAVVDELEGLLRETASSQTSLTPTV